MKIKREENLFIYLFILPEAVDEKKEKKIFFLVGWALNLDKHQHLIHKVHKEIQQLSHKEGH